VQPSQQYFLLVSSDLSTFLISLALLSQQHPPPQLVVSSLSFIGSGTAFELEGVEPINLSSKIITTSRFNWFI
jgi:hypothetical protein